MATIKLKYITLACVLAATVAAGSLCHNDYYQLKSVSQAQEECARYQGIPCARLAVYNKYIYPNDTQTQCMVRCMGLNLGWWNDTHGIQEPAMRSFFHPDPDDCDYERRTYHCLNSQRLNHPSPHVDVCERAYESFRCYYEQYGNIVVTPQFIPLSDLQQVDVLFQCANLLPFSLGASCTGSRKASKRDVDCLARCFLLRSGLYSEQHGPHLDRLYVQCNNYANETRFRETTGTCYQRLKSECQDECVLAASVTLVERARLNLVTVADGLAEESLGGVDEHGVEQVLQATRLTEAGLERIRRSSLAPSSTLYSPLRVTNE
uniref:Odorant-binding protein n=1 Tax=Anopheles melas TaxID=34690 RepID=A0A182TXQ4_9DIPT